LTAEFSDVMGIEAIVDDLGCNARDLIHSISYFFDDFLNKDILKAIKAYTIRYGK
jgi:hypothetical protein